jgi:hypothetical protein
MSLRIEGVAAIATNLEKGDSLHAIKPHRHGGQSVNQELPSGHQRLPIRATKRKLLDHSPLVASFSYHGDPCVRLEGGAVWARPGINMMCFDLLCNVNVR